MTIKVFEVKESKEDVEAVGMSIIYFISSVVAHALEKSML